MLKKYSIIVIVAAWVIGTLISELNVMGAEGAPAQLRGPLAQTRETIHDRWTERETEFALTLSGIPQLERVQRDSRMRRAYQQIVALSTPTQTKPQRAVAVAKPATDERDATKPAIEADAQSEANVSKVAVSKPAVSKVKDAVASTPATAKAITPTKEAVTEKNPSIATNQTQPAPTDSPATPENAQPAKLAKAGEQTSKLPARKPTRS